MGNHRFALLDNRGNKLRPKRPTVSGAFARQKGRAA